MSISFKADNELITAIRDRAMFNTFAGNQSYVIKGIGNELKVTVTPSTFNVTLDNGEAVICGGSTIIDSGNSLTLGANESGYLVIRVDLSQTQENICQFLNVPTLIQQNINNGNDLVYDLPLYQYTTNGSIVSSLVDVRDIRDHALSALDGGSQGQILTKLSSNDGDYGWKNTDYMEVDTLGTYQSATPINADLLEGHNASFFIPLEITTPSFSSLPYTYSNSNITSNMVVIYSTLSNPSAQTSNWTVTTSNGSLKVSGSINGSTTLTLSLSNKR